MYDYYVTMIVLGSLIAQNKICNQLHDSYIIYKCDWEDEVEALTELGVLP